MIGIWQTYSKEFHRRKSLLCRFFDLTIFVPMRSNDNNSALFQVKDCVQQGRGQCLSNEDLVNRYTCTSWGLSGCRPVDISTILILPHNIHAEIDNNVWSLGLPNSVVTFRNVPAAHRQESNLILQHQVYELGESLSVWYRRLIGEQMANISWRSTKHNNIYCLLNGLIWYTEYVWMIQINEVLYTNDPVRTKQKILIK